MDDFIKLWNEDFQQQIEGGGQKFFHPRVYILQGHKKKVQMYAEY